MLSVLLSPFSAFLFRSFCKFERLRLQSFLVRPERSHMRCGIQFTAVRRRANHEEMCEMQSIFIRILQSEAESCEQALLA